MMQNQTQPTEMQDLLICNSEKYHLNIIRKWTSFFSILGLVGIILMLLGALSMIFIIPKTTPANQPQLLPQMGIFAFYLVYGLIYLIPVIYMYRSSNEIKTAIFSNNQDALTKGFSYLGKHFKFLGILMLILLALIPVFTILSMIFMKNDFPIFPTA